MCSDGTLRLGLTHSYDGGTPEAARQDRTHTLNTYAGGGEVRARAGAKRLGGATTHAPDRTAARAMEFYGPSGPSVHVPSSSDGQRLQRFASLAFREELDLKFAVKSATPLKRK